MNMNKRYVSAAHKTVAIATACSITLGSVSHAATLDSSIDTKGSLAGVVAITAEINKDLAGDSAAGASLAGVLLATANIHGEMVGNVSAPAESRYMASQAVIQGEEDSVPEEYKKLLLADVEEYLNIRTAPGKDGALAGWLRPTDVAEIVSHTKGWFEIKSGEVTGYVSDQFSIIGEEAYKRFVELSTPYVTSKASNLNVRALPSTDSEILGRLSKGEKALIDPDLWEMRLEDAENESEFIAINYNDKVAYVSKQYVEIYTGELGVAMTAEEVEAYKAAVKKAKEEAAKKAAAEAAAKAEAAKKAEQQKPATVQNSSVSSTADDVTMLAALLMCEAGSNYEGMLAVGGVVMNRLRAGYASTIQGVIYQRGQFTPASSGKLARTIANGVSAAAIQAAQEAIAGVDITGGCKNFRSARSGHSGVNIGGNVFF